MSGEAEATNSSSKFRRMARYTCSLTCRGGGCWQHVCGSEFGTLAKLLSRFICPVVSTYAMFSSGGMPRLTNCSPSYKLQASVLISPNLSDPNAAPPGSGCRGDTS